MRDAGLVAVWLVMLLSFGSTGEWTWFAPWWTDRMSQSVVIKSLALALVLLMTLLQVLFPLSMVIPWVSIGLLYAIALVLAWRIIVIWQDRPPREHQLPARLARWWRERRR